MNLPNSPASEYTDIKILVLDDEVIISHDIKEMLHSTGFDTVKTVKNVSEAMEIALDWQPQLIFCDINLGEELNGIEVIEQLRNKVFGFEVVYISAYADMQLVEDAKRTDPISYLVKPFSEEQFQVALSFALDKINIESKIKYYLDKLTKQEINILHLIRRDYDTKKISETLFVSEKTVRNHRYNICEKLDIPAEKNSLLKWVMTNLNLS